jgi:mono/diheme cytochrome c family protein
MPPVGLPAAELDALVSLLQAQTAEDRGAPSPRLLEHFDQPLPAASGPAVGAMWARRLGCVGCHRLGQNDGGVPDLRHVAWTTTADQLQQTLRRPGRRFPGTLMPPLQAPTVIVDSVVSYLELQKVPLPSAPAAVFRQVCGRCHGQQRDARWVVLSRSPPLLEPRPRIERAAFIDTAARGREGTAMPTWGRVLSRGFLGQIYDQLEAQR